jgi:hypothetical protein
MVKVITTRKISQSKEPKETVTDIMWYLGWDHGTEKRALSKN